MSVKRKVAYNVLYIYKTLVVERKIIMRKTFADLLGVTPKQIWVHINTINCFLASLGIYDEIIQTKNGYKYVEYEDLEALL